MVKTTKKIFSILTVLCMMLGILSITAFADEVSPVILNDYTYYDGNINSKSPDALYSTEGWPKTLDAYTGPYTYTTHDDVVITISLCDSTLYKALITTSQDVKITQIAVKSSDGYNLYNVPGGILLAGTPYVVYSVSKSSGGYHDISHIVLLGSGDSVNPPVTPQTGTLTITKNVTGVGNTDTDRNLMEGYSVTVTYASGETATITGFQYVQPESGSPYWTASTPPLTLNAGTTYTVSEDPTITAPSGYTSLGDVTIIGGDNGLGSGTVDANAGDSVTLTNAYTKNDNGDPETPTGTLTITKNVTGVGNTDTDRNLMEGYSVTVTYASGETATITGFQYVQPESGSPYWTASTPPLTLNAGTTYTVSEDPTITAPSGYTSLGDVTIIGGDNGLGSGTVDANAEDSVTLTNAYTKNDNGDPETPTGTLTITKNVTGVGNTDTDRNLMEDYSVTVTYASGETATITGFQYVQPESGSPYWTASTPPLTLNAGTTYTVSEDPTITAPSGYTSLGDVTIIGGDNGLGSGTVDANAEDSVTLTNAYTKNNNGDPETPTGTLTITKTIGQGNAYSNAISDTYQVQIAGPKATANQTYGSAQFGSNQHAVVNVTTDTDTVISGLPLGDYTITEIGAHHGGYTLRTFYNGTVASSGTVTLASDETSNTPAATMDIVNTYTANGGGGGNETPNDPGTTTITETTTPLGDVPAEPTKPVKPTKPAEEIEDEPVALASVPQTGDTSALWFTLSGLSAVGLAGVYVLGKKRRDDNVQ